MNKMKALLACVGLAAMSAAAHADVVASAGVEGLATFQDTNTGRVWLRMDDFFDSATGVGSISPAQMLVTAQAAGFTWATGSDVSQLLDSLPLNDGQWSSYAAVMGDGQPRQLIWGAYDGGRNDGTSGWAWAWSSDTGWNIDSGGFSMSTAGAGNGAGAQDLGLWAYRTAAAVPEPSSWLMLGLGGLMIAMKMRRRGL